MVKTVQRDNWVIENLQRDRGAQCSKAVFIFARYSEYF